MKQSAQMEIGTQGWKDARCVEGLCQGSQQSQHEKCMRKTCAAGERNILAKVLKTKSKKAVVEKL